MKRLLGTYLILALFTCLFAMEGWAQIPASSQTLVPGVLLCRANFTAPPCQIPKPNSVTLTFTETPAPATEATLTFTMRGDINEPGESVEVKDEDGRILGHLGDPENVSVKTRSLTIPFSDLARFAADDLVDITFTILNGSGAAWARLDSVTLTYIKEAA